MTEVSPTRRTLLDSLSGEEPPSEAGLERGEVVGRYIVVERIGAGGMGVVYAAYDPELDRRVALKIMQPRSAARSDAVSRMLREAQALAKLAHPNVVAVHDVGEVRGGIFVAMEFVRGATLTQWAARTQPTWPQVLRVLRAAGEGLAAAHDKGLVHRDIKPDNVMIDDEGRVRVMDFGLARPTHAASEPPVSGEALAEGDTGGRPNAAALDTALTRDGAIVGTPGYMAPEQMSGGGVGPAADQFAFCVMAWEALYGRRPFVGSSMQAVAMAAVAGNTTAVPREKNVPSWVHRVVRRGLEAMPNERWPSMRALVAALAADPAPRQRRRLAIIGLGAVIAGSVAAVAWTSRAREAACRHEADAITEAWDPTTTASARAAFEAASPDGGAMFDRAAPWLDRYASQWHDAVLATCRAPEDAATADLRAHAEDCFAERRAELDDLARRWLAADADVVRGAVASAVGLAPVASCSDAEQLRHAPIVGIDRREEARAVRESLAKAAVARRVGDPSGGLAEAEAALVAARKLDFGALIARGHLEVGLAQSSRDDGKAAHAALREAHQRALAAGADDVAADAAIALMYVTGYQLERREEAGVWEDIATAGLERLGAADDDLRRIELVSQRAAVRAVSGRIREARDDFEQVLALQIARFGEVHPEVASTYAALAAAQYQLDDKSGSERSARRALELVAELYGDAHPERSFMLVGYSAMLSAAGRSEEAVQAARDAVAIGEAALGPDHPSLAVALNNLAMMLGPTDEAIALLERAKRIVVRHRGPAHREVAYCANNLGYLAQLRGDHSTALAEHTAAAEILESIENPDTLALAQTWHNVGTASDVLGRHVEAERAFERALGSARKAFGEEHGFVGDILSALGRSRVMRGQGETAIAPLEEAVRIHAAPDGNPTSGLRDRMVLARARWISGGDELVARETIAATVEQLAAAPDGEQWTALGRRWLAEPPRPRAE